MSSVSSVVKNQISSPFSVAELASVIRTFTKSPTRCVPRSNTTTRFCSVRPNSWSRERLETPSTRTSYVFPIQRWLDSADRRFCKAIISLRRRTFTSSGTLSSRCFEAPQDKEKLLLEIKTAIEKNNIYSKKYREL